MIKYLINNPKVGAVSGLGSGVLYSLQRFMMDEYILKFVAAVGIWGGTIVTLITVVVWIARIYKRITRYLIK
ncbi:hypothetical protein [Pedobacter sp. NJ-S-72]